MTSVLEAMIDSGDWTEDPKFLHDEPMLDEAGFALGARRQAAAALERVYPADECQKMRGTANFEIVAPLFFQTWPMMVANLLALGLDLALVDSWDNLDRLRRSVSFVEAAFEVRVWASLVRNGYAVRKIPTASEGTADFLVSRDGAECEVEVKFIKSPEIDVFVRNEASPALMGCVEYVDGFHLSLFGDDKIAEEGLRPEGFARIKADLPNMLAAFSEVAKKIAASPSVGRHEVPGYGHIQVEPGRRGIAEVTPLVFPEQKEGKRARRIFDAIAESVNKKQFSGKRDGIFVVGAFHKASPETVEQTMWQWLAKPGRSLAPTQMIVLVDNILTDENRYTQLVFPLLTRKHRELTKAQLSFAEAAGGDCHGRAVGPPRNAGVRLDYSRRNESTVKRGEVAMPNSASTVTFRFDGTPPEVTLLER
jgi:hypothetical protein